MIHYYGLTMLNITVCNSHFKTLAHFSIIITFDYFLMKMSIFLAIIRKYLNNCFTFRNPKLIFEFHQKTAKSNENQALFQQESMKSNWKFMNFTKKHGKSMGKVTFFYNNTWNPTEIPLISTKNHSNAMETLPLFNRSQ